MTIEGLGNRKSQHPAVRLVWATDIHLDHVDPDQAMGFLDAIKSKKGDGLLLGGDMSSAGNLAEDLTLIADTVDQPVYFVLGNHDFYGGSIAGTRRVTGNLASSGLNWLPSCGCLEIAPGVGLVGIGGWGDARNGNHENSAVMLTDYFVIAELKAVYDTESGEMTLRSQPALKEKLRALGRESAATLRPQLTEAAARFNQVIVLTHVPPFPEAAWHEGAPSADDWLPGFSCRAMGEELFRIAEEYPDSEFTVLCGHTHGDGVARILPNLVVHTQGAEYGQPGFKMVVVRPESVVLDPGS
jgi:predicted phosphohydrolase